MRVWAIVAYDGTDYSGFQRQVHVPTVQQAIETTLAQITQESITILAAGRTDAGVHAVGQVIAFDTAWRHTIVDLQRAMNAVLPADISVREVREASSDAHPRYDALTRRYRYTVYNAPVRCPLARRYSCHVTAPLNIDRMQQAARILVGEHDFAAFGRPTQGPVTVRRLIAAEWRDKSPWLTFDIEANAFLYRMVRSIVGTLLLVGQNSMNVDEFEAVLVSRDRSQAGPTASPQGLCLMEVKY